MNPVSRSSTWIHRLGRFVSVLALSTASLSALEAAPVTPSQQRPAAPFQQRLATPNAEARIRQVLERLQTSHTPLKLRMDGNGKTPAFLSGTFTAPARAKASAEQKARAFLQAILAPVGDAKLAKNLIQTGSVTDALGYTHVSFQQVLGEIPVLGAEVRVHLNPEGQISSLNGHLVPGLKQKTRPTLSAQDAQRLATAALEKELADPARPPLPASALELTLHETPVLQVLAGVSMPGGMAPKAQSKAPSAASALVFEVRLGRWIARIDAHSGELLTKFLTGDALTVETYTANGGTSLPGTLMASTSPVFESSSIDAEERAAHAYAVEYATWLQESFGRNSLNDAGLRLYQTVEYDNMDNAYWDGNQAVFGNGWATRDIVGHEFTHGLTDYTANLEYADASGALNESFSDIFAVMIDRDDWQQGEEADGFSTDNPVRSLSDPHKGDRFHPDQNYDRSTNSGQPAHMDEYLTSADALCGSTGDSYNGCVHFNSGIQNHAAYLMASGGYVRDILIQATGRSDTEQVFYRSLATRLTSYSDHDDARDGVLEACRELYGSGTPTCITAENAWAAVGVGDAHFNVLTVAADGSGQYTSIQAALNAAETGDHIQVAAGAYVEDLIIPDRGLVLEGAGADQTFLVGTGNGPVVRVSHSSSLKTLFKHLAVQGGNNPAGVGGGIACAQGNIGLESMAITENAAEYGGGLGIEQCAATLSQVRIGENVGEVQGGGVYSLGGLVASSLVVEANASQGSGGGLYLEGSSLLTDVQVLGNSALEGAGISAQDQLDAEDLTLTGNTASWQAGGMLVRGMARIERFMLVENVAELGGGAVLEGQVTLVDGLISSNRAEVGGGVAAYETASGSLRALTVVENLAAELGGGIYLDSAWDLDVANLIVSANEALAGGGIAVAGAAGPELRALTLVENAASEGSAVFVQDAGSALLDSSIVAYNVGGEQLVAGVGAGLTVTYSDVFDGGSGSGTNLNVEPGFVAFVADQDASTDDVHLEAGSACQDSGNPDPGLADVDGSRSDMGAFAGPDRLLWPGEWLPCFDGRWVMEVGGQISSSLGVGDSTDGPRGTGYYYEDAVVFVEAGARITISLSGSFDTYVYLYSPECVYLGKDDDSGSGTDSLLSYTVAESGYYSVIATSYDPGHTGYYTLSVTQ